MQKVSTVVRRGLPPLETPEHCPVKMQLEFGVHLS